MKIKLDLGSRVYRDYNSERLEKAKARRARQGNQRHKTWCGSFGTCGAAARALYNLPPLNDIYTLNWRRRRVKRTPIKTYTRDRYGVLHVQVAYPSRLAYNSTRPRTNTEQV